MIVTLLFLFSLKVIDAVGELVNNGMIKQYYLFYNFGFEQHLKFKNI